MLNLKFKNTWPENFVQIFYLWMAFYFILLLRGEIKHQRAHLPFTTSWRVKTCTLLPIFEQYCHLAAYSFKCNNKLFLLPGSLYGALNWSSTFQSPAVVVFFIAHLHVCGSLCVRFVMYHLPVLKNRRTLFERAEKFVSDAYFTDCNLRGR